MSAQGVAPARMLARWSLSDGTVEALKWLAFVAMVADHVDVILFDRAEPVLYALGRVAMPIFAVVFGYNLARSKSPTKALERLLWFGLLVQPIAIFTINRGAVLPLNILLTFAVGGLLVYLADRRDWVIAGAVALLAGLAVDYSIIGAGLVAWSWVFFRGRDPAAIAGVSAFVVLLCLLNGNLWALVGVAAVIGAGWVRLDVPRARWAFLIAYPVHMVALWAFTRIA